MQNLPSITMYKVYLGKASVKLNIPIDECRNRYGLFTIAQWEQLLKD